MEVGSNGEAATGWDASSPDQQQEQEQEESGDSAQQPALSSQVLFCEMLLLLSVARFVGLVGARQLLATSTAPRSLGKILEESPELVQPPTLVVLGGRPPQDIFLKLASPGDPLEEPDESSSDAADAAAPATSGPAALHEAASEAWSTVAAFAASPSSSEVTSTLVEPRSGRSGASVCVLGDRIYVVGGWLEGGIMASYDEFLDLLTMQWQLLPAMPTRRSDACTCSLLGKMYILGGLAGHGDLLENVEVFAPNERDHGDAGRWEMSDGYTLSSARRGAAVAAVVHEGEPRLYLFGGLTRSGRHLASMNMLNINLARTCSHDQHESLWQQAPRMPAEVASCAGAAVGGKLYAIGGWGRSVPLQDMFIFDISANAWERGPMMSVPRAVCAIATNQRSGRIYVVGGRTSGARALSSLEVYDTRSGTWTDEAPMPVGCAGASAVISWLC